LVRIAKAQFHDHFVAIMAKGFAPGPPIIFFVAPQNTTGQANAALISRKGIIPF
jgi:hypothetical protein